APSTSPTITALRVPMGNSGLVTLVGSENDGRTRSTRSESGASRLRVSLLSLSSEGCGIGLGPGGRAPGLAGLEAEVPERLWPVHPQATSIATASSTATGRRAAPGGRLAPGGRRAMSPSS